MEYVYAAMLLHTTGQKINEANVKKVLDASGAEVDDARIKALIAALEDVDIDEAIEKTALTAAAPAAAGAAPAAAETPEEEEEKKRKNLKKKKKKKQQPVSALSLVNFLFLISIFLY